MVKIMGVLNITPDSFSDGGQFIQPEQALAKTHELIAQGIDILDIGAESTRPTATKITIDTEINRLEPVLKLLHDNKIHNKVKISLDTQNSETLAMAIQYGVSIANDITSLDNDKKIAQIVKDNDLKLVLMYRQNPYPNKAIKTYTDVIAEIKQFLTSKIQFAETLGVNRQQIIIDPGMGSFVSNDGSYSYEIIRRLQELKSIHPEILVGISRKGFLGGEIADRDIKSLLLDFLAVQNGATIIRTHNPIHHHHLVQIHAQTFSN
jgi:dihydropteroate synthase